MQNSRRKFLKQSSLLLAALGINHFPVFGQSHEDKLRLIVDADTANEVDDLFAIVRAILEPRFDLRGITSAQWHTQERSPKDSVGASQQLNEEILELMDKRSIPHPEGANFPLVNAHRPQPSAAAAFIIEEAKATPDGEKLAIAILGPSTNPASAILMTPEIIPKLKIYYLGFWHHFETGTWNKREFNTNNDPNATNLLIDTTGLEFHVMTASTSQHLVFKKTVVDQHLKGKGGIADFLVKRWENYDRFWKKEDKEKTLWTMWDVALIEALANPGLALEQEVVSPHDNRLRNIFAYTQIDAAQMEQRFWKSLNAFIGK